MLDLRLLAERQFKPRNGVRSTPGLTAVTALLLFSVLTAAVAKYLFLQEGSSTDAYIRASYVTDVLAFTFLVLIYGRRSPRSAVPLIFLFLVVTRHEVLTFPPYWDFLWGTLREGLWLAQHDYDYTLLFGQDHWGEGGVLLRGLSIYPAFVGWGIKLFGPGKFIVAAHLLNFLMASIVVVMFHEILRRALGVSSSREGALLLLCQPLFLAQSEMLGEDFAVLFLSVSTVYLLVREREKAASLCAIMAAMVKVTGLAICFSLFVYGIVLSRSSPAGKKLRNRLFYLYPFPVSLLIGILMSTVGIQGKLSEQGLTALFTRAGLMLQKHITYNMYFLAFFLFTLTLVAATMITKISLRSSLMDFLRDRCRHLFPRDLRLPWLISIYGCFSLAVLFPARFMLVRYFLLFLPAGVFACLFIMHHSVPIRMRRGILLAACVLFLLEVPIDNSHPHSTQGSMLDGTREYRKDLLVNMRTAEYVQQNMPGSVIVTGWPMTQIFGDPDSGYVGAPYTVYSPSGVYGNWDAKEYRDSLRAGKRIFIYKRNPFMHDNLEYKSWKHRLIKRIKQGDKEVIIYASGDP